MTSTEVYVSFMACLWPYKAENNKQVATATVEIEATNIVAVEIGKATTTVIEIKIMVTAAIEANMKDVDAIKEEKSIMDVDAIKKEKGVMDIGAIRVMEKLKDVSQQKGEDLNLDCSYDNLPLGFEKPMSSGSRRMESQDPLEEINLGTEEN